MNLEDMTCLQGVYINPEKHRYEWNPVNLEGNIFAILSSLSKQLGRGFKVKGNISEHPDKEGWFIMEFK